MYICEYIVLYLNERVCKYTEILYLVQHQSHMERDAIEPLLHYCVENLTSLSDLELV